MDRRKAQAAQESRIRIKLLPSAITDLERGHRFYGQQSAQVGEYFLDSLFSDIDSLVLYAGIHRRVFGYQRLLARRFPYAVYYKMEGDTCIVFRVLDCRQDPERVMDGLR